VSEPDNKVVDVQAGAAKDGAPLNAQALKETLDKMKARERASGLFPRLRLAASIDLGKADPECPVCKGKGVVKYQDHVEHKKGFRPKHIKIPVICGCVVKGSGIAKDALDGILAQAAKKREERDAALEKARAEGKEKEFLVNEARGGFNTVDKTWVCQTCLNVVQAPGMEHGVPKLPDGWRVTHGRATCSDVCERIWQKQKASMGADFAGNQTVPIPGVVDVSAAVDPAPPQGGGEEPC